MTVDNQENLIVNIGGHTKLFNKQFVKDALKAHLIEEENKKLTFCANYNREQEKNPVLGYKTSTIAQELDAYSPKANWITTHTAERIKTDSVVEAVREDLLRRSQLGIAKYGTLLTREDIDLKGWLQHAYEENLDMANYLKRTIIELEKKENGN